MGSLKNGHVVIETQDTVALSGTFAFGGTSETPSGPQIGTLSTDPRTGAGIAAALGSHVIYMPGDGSVQTLVKTGALDVDWTPIGGLPFVADPGDAAAIPVDRSASIPLTIGAAAETNTIAAPTFAGQEILINAGTVGAGTRVITSALALNKAGALTITFAAANDSVMLKALYRTAILGWQVVSADGAVVA